ncbi:MAG: hypothetical protein ACYTG0_45795, partial [Planctomycetota bacterium]
MRAPGQLPPLRTLAIATAACWSVTAGAQTAGAAEGRAAGGKVVVERGQGAKLGEEGEPLVLPAPDDGWRPAGTLCFCFRPSRTIRFTSDPEGKPQRMTLVDCPVLKADLAEARGHAILYVTAPAAGEYV